MVVRNDTLYIKCIGIFIIQKTHLNVMILSLMRKLGHDGGFRGHTVVGGGFLLDFMMAAAAAAFAAVVITIEEHGRGRGAHDRENGGKDGRVAAVGRHGEDDR